MPKQDTRAAVDGGAPTEIRASPSGAHLVDLAGASLDDTGFDGRYLIGTQLGRGGMGEVLLCRDHRLGRQVALKVTLPGAGSHSDARARFLREARVQGQLEHPSIVPVYDLGRRPDGAPFFTMKRIHGVTLQDVIAGLARGEREYVDRFTRHRILAAFNSVCLAVDFAHNRGVVHRDLKPGNVMLGDFGEVYVLDWGLARISTSPDEPAPDAIHEDSALAGRSVAGAAMGTPGYMPPEQYSDAAGVGPPADIYALGSVLFELLALNPLQAEADFETMRAEAASGVEARASVRAPAREVPPELDAVCVRATQARAEDRFANAREMSEAIERYLAGERDQQLRRELARAHAERARQATDRALVGGEGSLEERKTAMREVGRALALDPDNASGLRILVRLLSEVPKELPVEAKAEMTRSLNQRRRMAANSGSLTLVTMLAALPMLFAMGVRDVRDVVVFVVLVVASAITPLILSRLRPTNGSILFTLGVSTLMIASTSLAFGPFILTPTLAASSTSAFVIQLHRRWRPLAVAIGSCGFLVPAALQWLGAMPPSYSFGAEGMLVIPRLVSFPPGPTWALLFFGAFGVLVGAVMTVARSADSIAAAEERLFQQAWALRQLVPEGAVSSPSEAAKVC